MSAEEVKTYTGYSIGGVPPFPHYPNVHVSADQSLFDFSDLWAAAGSNNTVMKIKPDVLTRNLKMPVVEVSE
jgi:prolyl-tRNA editing enzyme YbaK/EbsC (Cys-tRNA(Pro) deacylase)